MTQESNIWLIRTKQNKILGPITKQKIKDLIAKGSLTPEDEICSGNGYWFWIKEKELLEKYVDGDIPQDFNPVCEALTVVANSLNPLELETKPNYDKAHTQIIVNPLNQAPDTVSTEEEIIIPTNEDLEYPDLTAETTNQRNAEEFKYELPDFSEDNQPKQSNQSAELSVEDAQEILVPDAQDLEYPDTGREKSNVVQIKEETPMFSQDDFDDEIDVLLDQELQVSPKVEPQVEEEEVASVSPIKEMPKPVRKKKRRKKAAPEKMKVMSKRNDRIVFYLIGLVISIVLYGVYYYYTSILGKDIISKVSNLIFPEAHAQSIDLDQKKKFI